MIEERSASQILFGYLPDQTVDVNRQVWRVRYWKYAKEERNVDTEALRRELYRLAAPWALTGKDGSFAQDLIERRANVVVKSLDRSHGVELEPFPRTWICPNSKCRRLHGSHDAKCPCGISGKKKSLHFVGYCSECGDLKEPFVRRCPTHNQVRVTFPGTAKGAELLFSCPLCNTVLSKGFGMPACGCGQGRINFTVHRAAAVFTPRTVVIVNPPSSAKMREIDQAGGGPRALSWVLDGMNSNTMLEGQADSAALRRQLLAQGLPAPVVEKMLSAASESGGLASPRSVTLSSDIQELAENEAVTIALAMSDSRQTLTHLMKSAAPGTPLHNLYEADYPRALSEAGLAAVELVDRFPVLTGQFGYTRGAGNPGQSRLKAYRQKTGEYVVYGEVNETEALFVRLEPTRVASWLQERGVHLPAWADSKSAAVAILQSASQTDSDGTTVLELVTTLVHSYAHRLIRIGAVFAGIERTGLSELLVPTHLGFFMYASSRSEFVLGGLQAVYENDLHRLLREFVVGERRCALDPGCSAASAACVACLHLGEPSCRLYNSILSRHSLFGESGFFRTNVSRLATRV